MKQHTPIPLERFAGLLPHSGTVLVSDASCPDARFPDKAEYHGLGGWSNNFAWQWSKSDIDQLALSVGYKGIRHWKIAAYELLALYITEMMASDDLRDSFTVQLCDNTNCIAWVNKARCKFQPLHILIRGIQTRRKHFNYNIATKYIPSVANHTADFL